MEFFQSESATVNLGCFGPTVSVYVILVNHWLKPNIFISFLAFSKKAAIKHLETISEI